jgi:alkylresorcinol/alkylpyrone synthase
MPWIHSVARSLAPNYYPQEQLIQMVLDNWPEKAIRPERVASFQRNVLVGGRYLALPLEAYAELDGFGASNASWIETALPMAENAIQKLLEGADLSPEKISAITSTTVTGLAVPSLEARLMNRFPFPKTVKRTPLFGLGCLAGVAGINRVGDYLKGHPTEAALFLSTELCSLTLQTKDFSIQNIIAAGLFGDGCAAVLMVGDAHPLAAESAFEWSNPRSEFFPNTERIMGWDIVDSGFQIVLSGGVPALVEKEIPLAVNRLLEDANRGGEKLDFVVAHPGGPKVMQAMESALHLENEELKKSWDSLSRFGNMSSTSVLFILEDHIADPPPKGSVGIMAAMGPAFCAELNMLRR